jgi:hypothetical protein
MISLLDTNKPQETYTFTTAIPFNERKNDVELMNYLSDFRLKIVEVRWGFEKEDEWIQGGKFSNLYGYASDVVWVYDCEGRNRFEIVKKNPAATPDAPAAGEKQMRVIFVSPISNCPPPRSLDGRINVIADPSAVRGVTADPSTVRPMNDAMGEISQSLSRGACAPLRVCVEINPIRQA